MTKKIYGTRNYGMFDLCKFNRDIKHARLEVLKASIAKWGQLEPACCVRNGSERLLIKRGHHRYQACKELGAIFWYYIEEENKVAIFETEISCGPWTLADYLEAECRLGKPEYLKLNDYHKRTGIAISQCSALLTGQAARGGAPRLAFQNGTFRVTNARLASVVEDIVDVCKSIDRRLATNTCFVFALARIALTEEFEPERFLEKLSKRHHMFEKQATSDGYAKMIEDIYNWHTTDKVNLAFLADQVASGLRSKTDRL